MQFLLFSRLGQHHDDEMMMHSRALHAVLCCRLAHAVLFKDSKISGLAGFWSLSGLNRPHLTLGVPLCDVTTALRHLNFLTFALGAVRCWRGCRTWFELLSAGYAQLYSQPEPPPVR